MPPAAMIGIAAAGALAQGYGARKAQKQQNKYLQSAAGQFNPSYISSLMNTFSPAFGNPSNMAGYNQQMGNLMQNPGYIDPQLMNLPLHMSAQRGNQDLIAAQGKLGRTGMSGGLSSAYALANQAARTQRDVNTQQQYALWREQQRRADLDWVTQARNQQQQMAMQLAGGKANFLGAQQAPMPWGSMGGNMLQAGMGAYGAMGMPWTKLPASTGGGGPTQGTQQYWNPQQISGFYNNPPGMGMDPNAQQQYWNPAQIANFYPR